MSQILSELSVDVERTRQRYSNHPKFAEVVAEFSKLLRGHMIENKDKIAEIEAQNAEEERKVKEEEQARKMAESMPAEVKEVLQDPKVIKVINEMRVKGNLEFY